MKKVININFQGRVVPIEESAYDILKKYVESLRIYFANEEGRDEIINDIESRIAELFGETLKKGSTCITDDDVNRIIDSMGRPEDFDGEESNVKSQLGGEQKQQQSQSYQPNFTTGEPRRLYRDENHKVLGGVCSGIANYFGIDRVIIRILAIVFFGIFFIPYLIVWVAVPSTASQVIGAQRKRLFRDTDDKIIAGVCSGLAQYFGVNVWLPRLLFLIPFFSFVFRFGHWGWWDFPHFLNISFSPGALFIYIILWLVLPEAKTTADKLEMKGEKVDLNNIKTTIQNDMEGFGKRAEQWGKEFSSKAQEFGQTVGEKGKQFGTEATTVVRTHSRGVGDVIATIFKIFAYFILGCILFSVACVLFGLGVAATGLIPAWSFVLNNGWQTILAWGTLILFIWVPIIGIVTYIIRRLTGKRGNRNAIGFVFGGLWTMGWICIVCLIASISEDFKYRNNPIEEIIPIANPAVKQIEVKMDIGKYYDEDWYRLQPFTSLAEDSAYVRNVKIRIAKATNDSFSVKIVKLANGKTRAYANETASKIEFNVVQKDSVLTLGKGIVLNRFDKFRNQNIIVTISVPVGKKIKLNNNIGWNDHVYVGFGNDDWNWWNFDNEEGIVKNWNHNVWYVMTAEGKLKRADKITEEQTDDNNNAPNAVEQYKKSREDLQREYDNAAKEAAEKKRKADELRKELDKPVIDSNRYHYQPEKVKKLDDKKIASIDYPVSMQNLLMARLL